MYLFCFMIQMNCGWFVMSSVLIVMHTHFFRYFSLSHRTSVFKSTRVSIGIYIVQQNMSRCVNDYYYNNVTILLWMDLYQENNHQKERQTTSTKKTNNEDAASCHMLNYNIYLRIIWLTNKRKTFVCVFYRKNWYFCSFKSFCRLEPSFFCSVVCNLANRMCVFWVSMLNL